MTKQRGAFTYAREESPRFRVGDRVISFRNEKGTVVRSTPSDAWRARSHRIQVVWDGQTTPDPIDYYEEVFEPL